MSRIRVLPEILANKIAAGEIVERPASVVKELVENALDAGARTLSLTIEAGGKKRISVRDDGEGMTQDDAILAFEHHATSKLQSVEDLAAISTLGFRGEALPSIASISRLTLRTRSESAPVSSPGTEVEIHGGTIRSVREITWDRGSEITVRDLFFNVPARRKFLRSHETEMGHITRLVTHYALAHPEMRVTLESENRTVIDVVAVPSLKERIYQLFGDKYLQQLLPVEGVAGEIRVRGFASKPNEQRTNAYSQFFYVNRRMVRDKVMTSAVRQAYAHILPASAFPVIFLFIELPFDQVDVNVHPAKTEVRFRESSLVHGLVRNSIQRALVGSREIPVYQHRDSQNWPVENAAPAWSAGVPPIPRFPVEIQCRPLRPKLSRMLSSEHFNTRCVKLSPGRRPVRSTTMLCGCVRTCSWELRSVRNQMCHSGEEFAYSVSFRRVTSSPATPKVS